MYKIFNYNALIRDYLYEVYLTIKNNSNNESEITNKYKILISSLKETNYSLYKIIINVLFTDQYRILKYRDLYMKLSDDEEYTYNQYKNIMDIDELLYILDNDDEILNTFLFSSVNFRTLKKVNQANHMLKDYEYSKFLPLSYLERESIFSTISLEQLDSDYKELMEQHKELDAIDNFIDEILVRSIGNINNFKTLLIDMLNYFCKCKENINIKNNYFYDIDMEIIGIVKTKNEDEIINIFISNNELLTYLIKEYLYEKFQKNRVVNEKPYVKELKKEVLF